MNVKHKEMLEKLKEIIPLKCEGDYGCSQDEKDKVIDFVEDLINDYEKVKHEVYEVKNLQEKYNQSLLCIKDLISEYEDVLNTTNNALDKACLELYSNTLYIKSLNATLDMKKDEFSAEDWRDWCLEKAAEKREDECGTNKK